MSKLPAPQMTASQHIQHERLTRWRHLWEAELRMRAVSDGTPEVLDVREPTATTTAPPAVAYAFERPAMGEIRLLAARLTPLATRPVYVALLEATAAGELVVAPYGMLTEPATPRELLTGRTDTALTVLCLWNARTLPPEVLRESWIVDYLRDEEVRESVAILRHGGKRAPSAEALLLRTGPPVLRAEDPRVAYQEEESTILDHLTGMAIVFRAEAAARTQWQRTDWSPWSQWVDAQPALAAADRDRTRVPFVLVPRIADTARTEPTAAGHATTADILRVDSAPGVAPAVPVVQWDLCWVIPPPLPAPSRFVVVDRRTGFAIGDGDLSPDARVGTLRYLYVDNLRLPVRSTGDVFLAVVTGG